MGLFITRTSCPCCGSVDIAKALGCKDFTVSNEIFDIVECGSCTLRFTQSVPDQAAIGAYYQSDSYISHNDTEKGLINKLYIKARNYTLSWKMKLLDKSAGNQEFKRKLLDIGAGTGAFLDKAQHSGWEVTGLEPDEGARKNCFDKYGIQCELSENLFRLPSQKYDAVTMWHVLEHVHQLHEYIDQIKRVLKPGGVALIALPNYTSKDAEEYKIQINGGLSSTHLPQSHTCFFLIDLPDYTTAANVSNDDDIAQLLYNKIENAISNVEGGIGFAGGNKKNKLKKLR